MNPVKNCASTQLGAAGDATSVWPGSRGWIACSPFVRLSNLTIRCIPITQQSSVSGYVAIAWIPYSTEMPKLFRKGRTKVPTFKDVINIPTHAVDRPSHTITLSCSRKGIAHYPATLMRRSTNFFSVLPTILNSLLPRQDLMISAMSFNLVDVL